MPDPLSLNETLVDIRTGAFLAPEESAVEYIIPYTYRDPAADGVQKKGCRITYKSGTVRTCRNSAQQAKAIIASEASTSVAPAVQPPAPSNESSGTFTSDVLSRPRVLDHETGEFRSE